MRILRKRGSTESLLLCGVIGPPLFIVVFLIEGATRPGYSAWQTHVSYLALSNQGWEQIANFLVCGLLCIAFAVGLLFNVMLPAACFVLARRFQWGRGSGITCSAMMSATSLQRKRANSTISLKYTRCLR